MYVLRNNDSGKFVTWPGSMESYTRTLQKARRFDKREDAQREACGNETVVKYEEA